MNEFDLQCKICKRKILDECEYCGKELNQNYFWCVPFGEPDEPKISHIHFCSDKCCAAHSGNISESLLKNPNFLRKKGSVI